jgi:hypothetical protein
LLRAQERRFYALFYDIVTSKSFKLISFLIILANTVVLGLTKDSQSDSYDSMLENLNLFFFGFFCLEIIAKLAGEGFKFYLRDKFNWFDGAIVILSAIDISIVNTLKYTGNSKY